MINSIVRTCKTYLTPTLNSLSLFITGLHVRNIHQGSSSTIIMILMRNATHHFVCKTEPVTRLPVGRHRFVSFDITSSGRWQSELNYGLPATSVWSRNRSVNLESISRRMRYQTCPVVPPHYVQLTMDLQPLCPTIVAPVKNVPPLTGVDKSTRTFKIGIKLSANVMLAISVAINQWEPVH